MAIKIGGTTVIDDSRNLVNIASGAGVISGSSLPSTSGNTNGDLFQNTSDSLLYVFNGTKSVWEPVIVTPQAAPNTVAGSQTFTNSTGSDVTTTWTVPSGVYNFCVVVVGAGGAGNGVYKGGGGGGGLAYKNHIPCNPGDTFTIFLGRPSEGSNHSNLNSTGDAYITDGNNNKWAHASGGQTAWYAIGGAGGQMLVGDGGGDGGRGGDAQWTYTSGGGGGAAGYSGDGGNGAGSFTSSSGQNATNGAGGGGGGGGSVRNPSGFSPAGGGGGVGLLGEGTSGAGKFFTNTGSTNHFAQGGIKGSGGTDGIGGTWSNGGSEGGDYGGGSGGHYAHTVIAGASACRVVYKTGSPNISNYGFPSTNVT